MKRHHRLAPELLEDRLTPAAAFPEFVDPNPNSGNQFGATVLPLTTGNVVITSPFDDFAGVDAGAVYLFNGATGALISTLRGSGANNKIGSGGVTALTNGNYVIRSPNWDNGAVTDAGAVTWASGTVGINGTVSAANSLVGTGVNDLISFTGVTALTNGNYVVASENWSNGAAAATGAVTWGNGATGIIGAVSAANSLVGTTAGDLVGRNGVTALTSGNYVVNSLFWDNGAFVDASAVTWCNGATGRVGAVSAANSLVGTTAGVLGNGPSVTALTNGNYVVGFTGFDNGAIQDVGAVTWVNGNVGAVGAYSAANSLVGTTANDRVGAVMALTNGNYVVASGLWDNGAVVDAGAVTWCNGATGRVGVVSAANAIVGTTANDRVGFFGAVALTNGNYVVSSPFWNNGAVVGVGAATWGNGATGTVGAVSAANSLVGTTANDNVSSALVWALTNGNYVVNSPLWNNGAIADAGAATWGNGTTGTVGAVSAANSLVGTTANDKVGSNITTALTNGNYVVNTQNWDNGAVADVGAVTWGNGASGTFGAVSAANSLVGTTTKDGVSMFVTALTNGNYVVRNAGWDNGAIVDAGAATWGNGATGTVGVFSTANSLVGTTAFENVGGGGVTAFANGNYAITTQGWDNEALNEAGAVTFGSGTTGVVGTITTLNSAVGLAANANLQLQSIPDKVNQTFLGRFLSEGGGRVRVGSQVDGFAPTVNPPSTPNPGTNTPVNSVPSVVVEQPYAVAPDAGGGAIVKYFNADGTERLSFNPFPDVPGFVGGVRVATADFNRDGVADLALGTGPGTLAKVRVVDGRDTAKELFSIDPFPDFTGGVFVAVGDLTADGAPDLVITPDLSGGPRVRIFSGAAFGTSSPVQQIADFFGIADVNFRGGARAALGDVNGDGFADLIISAGFGGGPRIAVFSGAKVVAEALGPDQSAPVIESWKLMPDFFAFEEALRNGAYIGAGDLDGDGFADLFYGAGPGGGPRIRVSNGIKLVKSGAPNLDDPKAADTQLANFNAGNVNNRGGIRLAIKDLDKDGKIDLITGAGTGGSSYNAYAGSNLLSQSEPVALRSLEVFPGFSGGIFVG